MSNLDDRITAALNAAANRVTDADLTPAAPPTGATVTARRRPTRWIAPVIAAAAVAGIAISVTAVVEHHPQASKTIQPGQTNTPTPTTALPTTQSNSSGVTGTGEMVCYFSDASPCKVPPSFVWYVPLWPFANSDQVTSWRASNGSQPWHLDAGQTALNFTRSYLGFTDITMVVRPTIYSNEAKVGVGYRNPAGNVVVAAVLHLVRYERYSGDMTAPWEVVGSEDTSLSLETPGYDSAVGPKFSAGGHITGVDENLHIWVRSLDGRGVYFDHCCVPAGGQNRPWSQVVDLSGLAAKPTGPVTIVVSTGGHVQEHERFAIQGVFASVS